MNQITYGIDLLVQFIFMMSAFALGFGLMLRGLSKQFSQTLVRVGGFALAGALVMFVTLGAG